MSTIFKVGDRVFNTSNPTHIGTVVDTDVYLDIYKKHFIKVKYDRLNLHSYALIEQITLIKPKLFHYSI